MNTFRVDLDVYNGPLDLLLFLIRRDEVDVYDIPIARITGQYVAFVDLIQAMDPNLAGDFLVMAATLMEIKSRTLLPRPAVEEGEEEIIDPRLELVRQLLEYKTYKDAARSLGASAEWQALKYARQPALPESDPGEMDVEEVTIWDLLEAFNQLLEQTGRRSATHDVAYDDTPVALHAVDIVDALERSDGSQRFEEVFGGRSKSELIGLFLALLELIRQRRVRAEQDRSFGVIVLHLLDASPIQSSSFDSPGDVTVDEASASGPEPEAETPGIDSGETGEESGVTPGGDCPVDAGLRGAAVNPWC